MRAADGVFPEIAVLTGAGISAESGLATFRGAGGLWNGRRVEEVATIEGFKKDPDTVWRFYNSLKKETVAALPNDAHKALSRLQKAYPAKVSIFTQNVDLLHEKAGTQNVYHIHGRIDRALCMNCMRSSPSESEITFDAPCPFCGKPALKPDIVFFGEVPYYLDLVQQKLSSCGVFIAVGTSGVVYPAASFVFTAKENGAKTFEFNTEPSGNPAFDTAVAGKAGETLPPFVDKILSAVERQENLF